jgi:hypothetical protein
MSKPVARRGNSSVCLATRNAVPPASPLFWCLGGTDRGWTGTLGAVKGLERTAEVFRQKCCSRWRQWCRGFVASLAAGRFSRQKCSKFVVAVLGCGLHVVGWWRSDGFDESVCDNVVLSRYVPYVCRELGYEVQLVELPW